MARPPVPHLVRTARATRAVRRGGATAGAVPRAEPVESYQIIATVNGPGEVSAWVFPFAAALKARGTGVRLGAVVVPCVFASGAEDDVLREMPTVDAVCGSSASLRWIGLGETPEGFRTDLPGCVVHFGGELLLSIALARRLGYPIVMYSEGRAGYRGFLDKICFVDGRGLPGGSTSEAHPVVGNLMVDAAYMRVPVRPVTGSRPRIVAFFPGSRQYQLQYMLPFLIKVAGQISRERPDVRYLLARSPFVHDEDLAHSGATRHNGEMEQEHARWDSTGSRPALILEGGGRIEIVSATEAQRDADLAITIPGTNTAELGALGVPMLLIFPTYELHLNPIPGLAGHLTRIPLVGRSLKLAVATAIVQGSRFFAHPNKIANAAVVPEMVGKLTAAAVAEKAVEMLSAPLTSVSERLREVMGPRGAAERLVDEVLATMRTNQPAR